MTDTVVVGPDLWKVLVISFGTTLQIADPYDGVPLWVMVTYATLFFLVENSSSSPQHPPAHPPAGGTSFLVLRLLAAEGEVVYLHDDDPDP